MNSLTNFAAPNSAGKPRLPSASIKITEKLLTSPKLSRELRAICRTMYAEGKNISMIAARVQASRTTVKKAIRNGYVEQDDTKEDHRYVQAGSTMGAGNTHSTAPQHKRGPGDGCGHPVRFRELQTFGSLSRSCYRPRVYG